MATKKRRRRDPDFEPAEGDGIDEHDLLAGDTYSWQPAQVLDTPDHSDGALELMGYWMDRHRIVDATEEVLIAFAKLDVGRAWLKLQGWRYQDMASDDMLFLRRMTYEHMGSDLKEAWSEQFEAASIQTRAILRDWRQELRKCAMWLLAGDALDALKIAAFTKAEYADMSGPVLQRAYEDLTTQMFSVTKASEDKTDWLLESYVLLSSVADTDGLFHHQTPNKVLQPREPQVLTSDDTETS
jgi:hypothetical protein